MMNPAEFPIQTFLIELNHHFQNVDHPGLSGMLQDMISQPPSPNPQLEAKTPYFKKELDQSIQDMNGSTHPLKSIPLKFVFDWNQTLVLIDLVVFCDINS